MSNTSKQMDDYFNEIEQKTKEAYVVANKARSKGFDPVDKVEIILAKNLVERVEGLISMVAPQILGSSLSARILELEKQYGILDWRVAFKIALEVAQEKFCKFESSKEAIEVGIRTGIAYMTVGVVSSPLEGFVSLDIKKTRKGEDYFCLFYSGPIRSAGGTAASVSVMIADHIRTSFGYASYDPTEQEIKRVITEVHDYHEKITNLQYLPSQEELNFLLKNIPIQISGDPSEDFEVSNYKDLPRIETNRIRNGVCLVICEGICQKAKKLVKQISQWGNEFDMKDWLFLDQLVKIQNKNKSGETIQQTNQKIVPDYTYIKELVAGRPVLTHPLRHGGFRLRYGRTRTSGFSSDAIHPTTMVVLNDYVAIGTQLKVERPGKSTVLTVCDSIEGPIVKLTNGSVIQLFDVQQAKLLRKDIEEILYLGDILINYGDMYNRAHKLVPSGYCEEWYALELKKVLGDKLEQDIARKIIEDPFSNIPTFRQALELSLTKGVPLHPRYTYHWNAINKSSLTALFKWFLKATVIREKNSISKIIIPLLYDVLDLEYGDPKRSLELIGVPHEVKTRESVLIYDDHAESIALCLGFYEYDLTEEKLSQMEQIVNSNNTILECISQIATINLRDKSGTFIGARVGRPEKAKIRKLTGSPHVLFPCGEQGGKMRSIQEAIRKKYVVADFPYRICDNCNLQTIYNICEGCGSKTRQIFYCNFCNKDFETNNCKFHGKVPSAKTQSIDIGPFFSGALKISNLQIMPELIKGVRGTSNFEHIPEHPIKGILRSYHQLYVNRDGTIRYDMTELGITHFKPREIGTSIDQLRALGYFYDIHGGQIVNDDQVIEIKPQDVIIPACPESEEDGADDVLFRISKFIDQLMEKLYDLEPYYNLKTKNDLVGHLIVGLSPHTSAGILGRIIGFSKTQGLFAHPLFHSIMRRDLDGDEACLVLLLDALINFSRMYLPNRRGVTQDAPLVLTSQLIPKEVDDMVFDMDTTWQYPLELYEAALLYHDPWQVRIPQLKQDLDTEKQYEHYGFTHSVSDINDGVRYSAYKSIPAMEEKVKGQMKLAEMIRAVDESDVARLVIDKHFIKDIKGNLRRFGNQQFRCSNCNEKYRRPPLAGHCLSCGKGNLIFTVSEGFILKYLAPSMELAKKYNIPAYLLQTLELTQNRIESVFGKDDEKQQGLKQWFS